MGLDERVGMKWECLVWLVIREEEVGGWVGWLSGVERVMSRVGE